MVSFSTILSAIIAVLTLTTLSVCETVDGTSRIIFLKQSHFDTGTLRISIPGKYQLCEDIVFNPLRNTGNPNEEGAYYPIESDADLYPGADYVPGAFRLGFFASIVIEANDVEIDLNGKEIKMAVEFQVQQRFYAHIEIGSSPFIQGQGPAHFGPFLSPQSGVSNILITNGRLGLSSHHGIHSNGATNVTISNLKIYDFEVGGIQMNHFSNVIIRDVDIGPSAVNVPVTAYWSNARFGLLNFRYLRNNHGDQLIHFANRQETKSVEDIVDDLQLSMDALCTKFFSNGNNNNNNNNNNILNDDNAFPQDIYHNFYKNAESLFVNKDGLPDGSAIYGIILNSKGVAVNWFGFSKGRSQKATIENVTIHDIHIKVLEFGAFKDSNGFVNVGPYGDIINMFTVFDVGRESLNHLQDISWRNISYRGHVLSDAQIALGMFGEDNNEKGKAGTLVSSDLIQWVTQGTPLPASSNLICNADVMFHAVKGTIGLRIDNVDGVFVNNLLIHHLNNWSEFGHYTCNTNDKSNPSHIIYSSQFTIPTQHYEATSTHAITVTNSNHVFFGNVHIHDIASSFGPSFGLHILDSISDVHFFDSFSVHRLTSASSFTLSDVRSVSQTPIPNVLPFSCAFFSSPSAAFDSSFLHSADLYGPSSCPSL